MKIELINKFNNAAWINMQKSVTFLCTNHKQFKMKLRKQSHFNNKETNNI